jgi:TRAP-type C4-dicarboxylate transport system substrate-binding protein
MNATGANAVPMPFTETYTALEQGTIDGMTNPLLNILDGKYNEVSKHLLMTNHMYTPQIVIVSKKSWDKLSPADQKILRDAAVEATVFQRKVARDEAAKALEAIRKSGMTVSELTPADVAKLKEAAKPVIAKHTKTVGEDFVAEVNAELAKVRAAKK